MRRSARDKAEVRIVWRGGATTDLIVMMPVNSLAALPRYAEMERRICELAAKGLYDDQIIQILADEGHRSPWRGTAVLPSTVRGIRLRHGIKAVPRQTRWPPVKGCLTVTQLAKRLRITMKWSHTQLLRGANTTINCTSVRHLISA